MDEQTTPRRFTTERDVKHDIMMALAGSEGTWGNEEVDAIFREAYTYRVDTDDRGQELLNTAGFEQTVSVDEFWEIVAKYDQTGK